MASVMTFVPASFASVTAISSTLYPDAGIATRIRGNLLQRAYLRRHMLIAEAALVIGQSPLQQRDNLLLAQRIQYVHARLRDNSAEIISNDGFSVVAPISRMLPFSTCGRNASC